MRRRGSKEGACSHSTNNKVSWRWFKHWAFSFWTDDERCL